MNKPRISFIMPAYNGERFIADAIRSVISQTESDWELIIVDDASLDFTVDIIKKFSDRDSRIRFYQNDINRGISYTTNRAISEAQGEYLALIDDDDMVTPDRGKIQSDYMEKHKEFDILGGASDEINENGEWIRNERSEPLHNPKLIKAYMHFYNRRFSNGTTMIRKKFLEDHCIRFEEGCYGIQDFKFIVESTKVGLVSSINRLVQHKRIHKAEATNIYSTIAYEERRKKFSEIQRESIEASGFVLSESSLQSINDCINTTFKKSYSFMEAKGLMKAFDEMIEQGKEMKIDYQFELEYACKRIMGDYIVPRMQFDDCKRFFNID